MFFSFSPGLSVVCYTGDKEKRAELQAELLDDGQFHVLLTTYEVNVRVFLISEFQLKPGSGGVLWQCPSIVAFYTVKLR